LNDEKQKSKTPTCSLFHRVTKFDENEDAELRSATIPPILRLSAFSQPAAVLEWVKTLLPPNVRAVENVTLVWEELLPAITSAPVAWPQYGAFINGLSLDGAFYDTKMKQVVFEENDNTTKTLPVMHCWPVSGELKQEGTELPIVQTRDSQNIFLGMIKLKGITKLAACEKAVRVVLE
jgi:hypothetical protein